MFNGFVKAVEWVGGIVSRNVLVHLTLAMILVIAVLNAVWFLTARGIRKGYRARRLTVLSLTWAFVLFGIITIAGGATLGALAVSALVLPILFLMIVYFAEGIFALLIKRRCYCCEGCGLSQPTITKEETPGVKYMESRAAKEDTPKPFFIAEEVYGKETQVPYVMAEESKPRVVKPAVKKAAVSKKQTGTKTAATVKTAAAKPRKTTTTPKPAVKAKPVAAKPAAATKPIAAPVVAVTKNIAIAKRVAAMKTAQTEEELKLERQQKRIAELGNTIEKQRQHDIIVADNLISEKEEGYSVRTQEAKAEAKSEEERLVTLQQKFAALKQNHVVEEQTAVSTQSEITTQTSHKSTEQNTIAAKNVWESKSVDLEVKQQTAAVEVNIGGQKQALAARVASARAKVASGGNGKYDENEVMDALAGLRGAMSAQRGTTEE